MRFYCTDDTVDMEQYPYHVRDVHISDPFILADPKSRCYYTYVLMYSLRIQNVSQMWKLTKNTVYFMYLKVRI